MQDNAQDQTQSNTQTEPINDEATVNDVESFVENLDDLDNNIVNQAVGTSNFSSGSSATAQAQPVPYDDLKEKYDDLQHKYLRLYADFENYKREQATQISQESRRAKKGVILNTILPLLDNLKLASDHAPTSDDETVQKYIQTVKTIFDKTMSDVQKTGARVIAPSIGENFDQQYMEAIQVVSGNEGAPEHSVLQVVSFGLELDNIVIQPARVIISE